MKKGLLSLLAVALTVVGCQNYDDQFDDLKTQITDLATTVAGLSQVQSDLTALGTAVSNLSTAIQAIPTTDSVADLTASLSNQAAIIDSLQSILSANTLTQAQLAAVSATLADVQDDVQTLLQGDSVISPASGGIIITNEAQLGAAENLVPSDADAGTIVLDGFLDVRVGTGFLTTQDQLDRANAVLAKFATVIGTVDLLNSPATGVTGGLTANGLASSVGTVTLSGDDAPSLDGLVSVGGGLFLNTTGNPSLPALTSVGGDLERLSGGAPTVAALRTVGGDLNARHTGDWNYSQVTSVGGDAIVPTNATSINLTGVTVTGDILNPGGTVGQLTQTASTTGAINLGTAGINNITANAASSIVGAVTSLTNLTINAAAASSIRFDAALTATGTINITSSNTTVIHFDALTNAEDITISNSAESHFGALVDANTITVAAETAADFGDLLDLDAAASIGGATVMLDSLASATSTLVLPDATTVTFPNFVATDRVTADSATSITLKSIAATNILAEDATSLSVTSQDVVFTLTDATRVANLGSLTSVSVTGSGTAQRGVVTTTAAITSNATLTSVTLGGKLDSATVSGAGVTSLSTSGYITDLTVNNTGISTLDLNHDFIGLDTAVTITITNNSDLTSVDLADIDKVRDITITGNASVTSIVAPAAVYPEAGATVALTVTGADIAGTWTEGATPTVATETVPQQAAVSATFVVSSQIESLLDWYDAANAATTPAASINIEFSDITYYARTRNIDGTTTVATTATAPAPASFGAAVALDSYVSAYYAAGDRGTVNLDNATDLGFVTRN